MGSAGVSVGAPWKGVENEMSVRQCPKARMGRNSSPPSPTSDRVPLSSSDCPGAHHENQAGLELTESTLPPECAGLKSVSHHTMLSRIKKNKPTVRHVGAKLQMPQMKCSAGSQRERSAQRSRAGARAGGRGQQKSIVSATEETHQARPGPNSITAQERQSRKGT